MTNGERSTKSEAQNPNDEFFRTSDFVLRISFVIRISDFVIPPNP